eukprot:16436131-Heterocapsa_arctica.AAC.1
MAQSCHSCTGSRYSCAAPRRRGGPAARHVAGAHSGPGPHRRAGAPVVAAARRRRPSPPGGGRPP